MENIDRVIQFYDSGAEIGRLDSGLGRIERFRTFEILEQYIPDAQCTIYDIGGGIGVYSSWLAQKGHDVHLMELAPAAVAYALANQPAEHPFRAEVCDARAIPRPDESADVVLLMGPLYHLQKPDSRRQVLAEAVRVLKSGGLFIATAISKFSSTTWGLATYRKTNHCLEDDAFIRMTQKERSSGIHDRPPKYPGFIAQAYFHTPMELNAEIEAAGLTVMARHAIEGIIWFTPDLEEQWSEPQSRERLLAIVKSTEHEDSIMGMSPHFMIAATKPA